MTIVIDPPAVETNRFWDTIGDLGPDPSHHRLVGNDPETGVYSNDGLLAESWEASDDFRTWTFRLKPDAEWHFDWGSVTAADVLHSYELHNAPIRPSELGLRNTFTDQGSQYHGYEDDTILEMIEAID